MSIKFDKEKEKLSLKNKGITDDKVIKDLITLKENTPHLLKSKIPCEMYDKINLMCRKYMDRMARFEVDYDFIVDEKSFKNVAICFLECAPFMHSKVINHPVNPYWKVCDYHIDDTVIVKAVDDIKKAREEFFSQSIPLSSNVQIRIGLFYCENKTYICFIWNHMGFDGGGYKAFWTDFCQNYSEYVLYGKSPVNFSTGLRNYDRIYKDMEPDFAKKAKKQLANVSPKDKHILPFENRNKEENVIIVSREVSEGTFSKVIEKAKSVGATVNDVLLSAYINAFGKVTGMRDDEGISVACATDLRRHLKDSTDIGYTNHVSFIHCAIESKGKDIRETLNNVSAKTKELKKDPYIGLHGIPLLNFAYKSMFYIQAEAIVKLFYKNPTLSVSNVGAINTNAFSLANNPPFSAFVAGAAKNKPCAVMTALTINGKLNASMCLRGNENDKELLERFFTEFKKSIESLA
ncbi:MAG: hypothetical protein J6D06_02520 [Clostridia bacterium]|nr:hypothetical protein [Clostridia bacterium]